MDPCEVFMHPSIMIRARARGTWLRARGSVLLKSHTDTGTTDKAEELFFCGCVPGDAEQGARMECFFCAAYVGWLFLPKSFTALTMAGGRLSPGNYRTAPLLPP
jgi:hypothetical protein